MRNQAINATFECYKKRSKSFDDKTKSSCVKGGEEGNFFQIEDELNKNIQNEQDLDFFKENELYGDNIRTMPRTVSLLNKKVFSRSEENKPSKKIDSLFQGKKVKKKGPNFILKSDFLKNGNKMEQKNSFQIGNYTPNIDNIINDDEKEKIRNSIKQSIETENIKPYIPKKDRNKPLNIYQKNQSENCFHTIGQSMEPNQYTYFNQNKIQINGPNYQFLEIPNNIKFKAPNYRLNLAEKFFRNNIQFSASNNQFNPLFPNSNFSLSSLGIKIQKLIIKIQINNDKAITAYEDKASSNNKLVEYGLKNNIHNENNIINNYYFHDVEEAYNFIIQREENMKLNSIEIKK